MSAVTMARHAVAVYWATAKNSEKEEAFGLHSMAEYAAEEVERATTELDRQRAESASCMLGQTSILTAIVRDSDKDRTMSLLEPALALLKEAKRLLDEQIEETVRARQAA